MPGRALVLDANILVRAVLGNRVREIIEANALTTTFFLPEPAYAEAEEHLPMLASKRGNDPEVVLALLRSLASLLQLVGIEVYGVYEEEARARLGARDPDDWPVVAAAIALGCPVWTEDADFLGCGVATWTSDRVKIFLGH